MSFPNEITSHHIHIMGNRVVEDQSPKQNENTTQKIYTKLVFVCISFCFEKIIQFLSETTFVFF